MKSDKSKLRYDLMLIAGLLVIAGILYFVFQAEKSGGGAGSAQNSAIADDTASPAETAAPEPDSQMSPETSGNDNTAEQPAESGSAVTDAPEAEISPDTGGNESAGLSETADTEDTAKQPETAEEADTKAADENIRGEVVVYHGGDVIGRYPLSEDGVFSLNGGTNEMTIKDGQAWMSEAECPDGLCKSMGQIHYNGDLVVCLPNQIFFTVENGDDYQFDGIAR